MKEFLTESGLAFIPGVILGAFIGLFIVIAEIDELRTEENCVEFYEKYNYITNECKIYETKLKNIKK